MLASSRDSLFPRSSFPADSNHEDDDESESYSPSYFLHHKRHARLQYKDAAFREISKSHMENSMFTIKWNLEVTLLGPTKYVFHGLAMVEFKRIWHKMVWLVGCLPRVWKALEHLCKCSKQDINQPTTSVELGSILTQENKSQGPNRDNENAYPWWFAPHQSGKLGKVSSERTTSFKFVWLWFVKCARKLIYQTFSLAIVELISFRTCLKGKELSNSSFWEVLSINIQTEWKSKCVSRTMTY